MALNDTFKILPSNTPKFGAYLTSNFPIKDYWEEECIEHPTSSHCKLY